MLSTSPKEVAANQILSKQDILDFEAEHGQLLKGPLSLLWWSKRCESDAIRNLDEMGFNQGGAVQALNYSWTMSVMRLLIQMLVFQQNMAWLTNTPLGTKHLSGRSLELVDQVPAVGALISIAFPHWDKATGSPVRAVAIYLNHKKNTEEIFVKISEVCEQRHPSSVVHSICSLAWKNRAFSWHNQFCKLQHLCVVLNNQIIRWFVSK